jgi:opacity protein-like surface antigen
MKNLKAVFASSLIALSLASAAFAKPSNLETYNASGVATTATASFSSGSFSSTNEVQQYDLETFVPDWSLGVVGVDINGANLKIKTVEGSSMIHVELTDASGGASQDKLKFTVTADANTPKGSYPILVTLENTKFGESGTVLIVAEVQ